jgi:diacylglycerol kinase
MSKLNKKDSTAGNSRFEKTRSLLGSFKNAGRGAVEIFRSQRNFRLQLLLFGITLIAGFFFNISGLEWLIVILVGGMVLTLEIINTALESVVDLVTEEYKELARRIKDVSAGAVLVSSLIAIAIGLIIFIPRFIELFK